MTPDELVALHESVSGVAARHWGPATAAGTGKLGDVWAAGAAQAWSAVRLGPALSTQEVGAGALTLLRLGLVARALAAAQRAHEMAIEHAKTRRQFGRPIGSFGAVQQRVAAGQIDVSAGNHL